MVRRPVRLASRSLFHSAGSGSSRLVALYLYAPATATLPMEVDARLPRGGPGILLHYSAGRACDEWRQIAAGTCWINLLSISSVTSPRHSCSSRIVAPCMQPPPPARNAVTIILLRPGYSAAAASKGAITSKIKHAIKYKTSPARLAQLLHNCCSPH